ncbi:hypothetical protein LTR37_015966 [Vermiconidia calcicola]|uniref:Uncharacterized protein n=1 Tax=Vermiconidia calcicola TaxID=1690605 RepID=A0ACC3MPA3_9PEZI|nr:hypothetical protein LTR37_015966 [Vermiconidia calcicola]
MPVITIGTRRRTMIVRIPFTSMNRRTRRTFSRRSIADGDPNTITTSTTSTTIPHHIGTITTPLHIGTSIIPLDVITTTTMFLLRRHLAH